LIIDTILFNQDFEALEIRLEELYETIDLFVICESKFTFSGIPKDLHLTENLNKISKYIDKIRIVTEQRKHFTKKPFIREIHQRKVISRFLKSMKVDKTDIIIHSDCDEIPRKSVIEKLRNNTEVNVLLEMRNFTNYLNMELGVWTRARIVSGKNYRSIEGMRQDIFLYNLQDRSGLKKYLTRIPCYWTTKNYYLWKLPIFFSKPKLEVIKEAGWHFNNLFPKEVILEKIKASSHTELDTDQSAEKAIRNYLTGKDIYFGRQYKRVKIDETYPSNVCENLAAWKSYIY
jgi:beta-1,4-mannosyl-glycoprotein beta-1,4-N-acetylglucosaminyltransferase